VFPRKLAVLGFGGVGRKYVAKYVLLTGKLLQVLVKPHGPVAGGRDLVALQVHELVGRYVISQNVAAFGHERSRKYDAVKYDIVLPNEMYQLGFVGSVGGGFPPFFPTLIRTILLDEPIFRRRDVPNR